MPQPRNLPDFLVSLDLRGVKGLEFHLADLKGIPFQRGEPDAKVTQKFNEASAGGRFALVSPKCPASGDKPGPPTKPAFPLATADCGLHWELRHSYTTESPMRR